MDASLIVANTDKVVMKHGHQCEVVKQIQPLCCDLMAIHGTVILIAVAARI